MIYFDNAATSFLKPEAVYNSVYKTLKLYAGNPGRGGHMLSMKANEIVYEARETIADFFGIKSVERVCFTNNATSALNFGIKGVIGHKDKVLISGFEHNSVTRPLYAIGADVEVMPWIDYDNDFYISGDTKMIIVNHMSNVNGNISNIRAIGEYAKKNNIIFMVDASQSAGHIPINVIDDNIDILACSGHKGLLGPQGTGVLYVREGINIKPLIEGGTGSFSEEIAQPEVFPDILESGTLNVAGIGGLCEGIKYINKYGLYEKHNREKELMKSLVTGLRNIKKVIIYNNKNTTIDENLVSINVSGWDCVSLANFLSEKYGVCVRGGMHCAPLAHKTMGTENTGTVRISLSHFNTFAEINHFLNIIDKIANVM